MPVRVLLLFLICAAAPAATFRPTTTSAMLRAAERVCCVVCEGAEPRIDPRSGIVFTHVRLRVLEDLKGRGENAPLELRIAGGRVGHIETRVAGMPRFRPGRETIVFLGRRNRAGYPVVMEAARGVLRVGRLESGERVLAGVSGFRELKGRALVRLADFRRAVRAELRRAAKEKR